VPWLVAILVVIQMLHTFPILSVSLNGKTEGTDGDDRLVSFASMPIGTPFFGGANQNWPRARKIALQWTRTLDRQVSHVESRLMYLSRKIPADRPTIHLLSENVDVADASTHSIDSGFIPIHFSQLHCYLASA
jgi:hypothetical protein